MKIWIASDNTHGRYIHVDHEGKIDPIAIAYEHGRAESGEIINIYESDDTSVPSTYDVYWDSQLRKYKCY